MRHTLRIAIVVLVSLVVGALGLGSGAQAQEGPGHGGQAWGFIDTPTTVESGSAPTLVASWRNASDVDRTYEVQVRGVRLAGGASYDWSHARTLTSGESFRDELSLPAFDADGLYRARLIFRGVDVVAPVDIRVGEQVRVQGLRVSGTVVRPEARRTAARSVATSFRVSEKATVSARITDRAGRTVLRRSLGRRDAGAAQRWTWSGRGSAGRTVAAGAYTIHVTAAAGGDTATETVRVTVRR